MKVEFLNKSDNEVEFVVDGVTSTFVNAIRRYGIAKVPTFAIEDVEFKKNSSALYDEIIAHRLGLIPLTTKSLPSKIGYEGARVKFKLKAKGPGYVYASDLKTSDDDVVPVYDKIPIVYLAENQEIDLTATAILGIGADHAKFSPGLISFRAYPKITIGRGADGSIAEVCPKGVLINDNGKLKVDESKLHLCELCKACEDASDKVKVEGEENKFIVYVESWGQMKAMDILTRAAKVLLKDLDKFQKSFK